MRATVNSAPTRTRAARWPWGPRSEATRSSSSWAPSPPSAATRWGPRRRRSRPNSRPRRSGARELQGFVAPLVPRACFVIRKPARRVFQLANYVHTGVMTPAQKSAIEDAVRDHENILVCGGTGSGKTTLCNAILLEMSEQFPHERIVVLEDTGELQCRADDHLQLRTSEDVSLSDLVRSTLRCTPDRIVVGEVRDGAALHLLDAWATGHPGGCATVHATDARGALRRLNRLAMRAGVPAQHELVAEAVGVVVVIQGGNRGRRVQELVRVADHRDGAYVLDPV